MLASLKVAAAVLPLSEKSWLTQSTVAPWMRLTKATGHRERVGVATQPWPAAAVARQGLGGRGARVAQGLVLSLLRPVEPPSWRGAHEGPRHRWPVRGQAAAFPPRKRPGTPQAQDGGQQEASGASPVRAAC